MQDNERSRGAAGVPPIGIPRMVTDPESDLAGHCIKRATAFDGKSSAEHMSCPSGVRTVQDLPQWSRQHVRSAFGQVLQDWAQSRSAESWTLFLLLPAVLPPPRQTSESGRVRRLLRARPEVRGGQVYLVDRSSPRGERQRSRRSRRPGQALESCGFATRHG